MNIIDLKQITWFYKINWWMGLVAYRYATHTPVDSKKTLLCDVNWIEMQLDRWKHLVAICWDVETRNQNWLSTASSRLTCLPVEEWKSILLRSGRAKKSSFATAELWCSWQEDFNKTQTRGAYSFVFSLFQAFWYWFFSRHVFSYYCKTVDAKC